MNDRWTLYYKLNTGDGIGRIDSINKIGWTNNYIFAEHDNQYFFIDKAKDNQYLNSNDIVIGPFKNDKFLAMLDSLKITNFEFQIHLGK